MTAPKYSRNRCRIVSRRPWQDRLTDVNLAVVNGGVIACAFGDPVADRRAVEILPPPIPAARWSPSTRWSCSLGAAGCTA
jgi:hypothetical protein